MDKSHDELPPFHTTVLCFRGGLRFGECVLGYLDFTDSDDPTIGWIDFDKQYFVPDAWCHVPDAPEWIK